MTILFDDFLYLKDLEFPVRIKKIDAEEFYVWLEHQPIGKYELLDGQIVEMAGASIWHSKIIANAALIDRYLTEKQSPCSFYPEVLLKVNTFTRFQPDFAVICHLPQTHKYIENPVLVGEVLSSNASYDFNHKLPLYQKIQSIQEILYLEQTEMKIYLYRRNSLQGWEEKIYLANSMIELESIGLSVSIADFYQKVIFPS